MRFYADSLVFRLARAGFCGRGPSLYNSALCLNLDRFCMGIGMQSDTADDGEGDDGSL